MARMTPFCTVVRWGLCWAVGLSALVCMMAMSAPLGARPVEGNIYFVVAPVFKSSALLQAAGARLIDQPHAFAQTRSYIISVQSGVAAVDLYKAGAWLVLAGTPQGCSALSAPS